MRRSRLAGFTLVELLVVITIIGLLAALIVPAVQGALERARQNTCNNNLSQTGLAAITYASDKGYFPGYLNKLGSNNVSWHIALFDKMGRKNDYDAWVSGTGPTPIVEGYLCPSDNTAVGLSGPYTSFAVNTGKSGNDDTNSVFEGICHNLTTNTAKSRRVSLDNIPDGADMTILAVENLDANKYHDTAMGNDPEDILGISWGGSQYKINVGESATVTRRPDFNSQKFVWARPSSNHSGVVNVVFAGRNTRSLDEAIDKKVFEYLMTPNGKKVTPIQNDNTVLSKEF